MSFRATITVDEKTFEVLECVSDMEQAIDMKGKAISSVRGGDIRLVLRGTDEETIPAWASDKNKKLDGTITYYKIDVMEGKFREIKFEDGYITWFAESFMMADSDENFADAMLFQDDFDEEIFNMVQRVHKQFGASYLILCKVSAKKISIDDVKHDNAW
jgi:hypothetical protein